MTLRSIDSKNELDLKYYSELLFGHLSERANTDLRQQSDIYKLEHPALIKTRICLDTAPETLVFHAFENYSFELSSNTSLGMGKPYQIHKFLKTGLETEIQLPWSGIKLSKKSFALPEAPSREHFLTQTWLDYALSPELWGPQGKWNRFHGKLIRLFEKFDLLETGSDVGFYRLKSKIKLIEKHGFQGDDLGDLYQIVLPWDFSLSSLIKLEEILTQEF